MEGLFLPHAKASLCLGDVLPEPRAPSDLPPF